MKRLSASLVTIAVAAGLLLGGCTQAAPAPTPTKAAPAPTRAAEPTKPATAAPAPTKAPEPTKATAQPTAAAAPRVDFPQKGKAITIVVAFTAGGSTDLFARTLAAVLEKELATSVQILNRGGAGGQIGYTELAQAKPDGYTLGAAPLGSLLNTYLDPERKAAYSRKSFQPVGNYGWQSVALTVTPNSPYKSAKDLLDAAKATPGTIKVGIGGWLGTPHIGILRLEAATGARFATVQFDGGAPAVTALLGSHIDGGFNTVPEVMQQVRTGQLRALAVMSPQESKFLPGVKTLESQGYKVFALSNSGITGPAGIPPEVLAILDAALKKAVATPEYKQKMEDLGYEPDYMGPADFAKFWDDNEKEMPGLIEQAKKSKS